MRLIILFKFFVIFYFSLLGRYNYSFGQGVRSDIYSGDYYVYRIDSLNSFYLIYAQLNGKSYKIISQKEAFPYGESIIVGSTYSLNLISVVEQLASGADKSTTFNGFGMNNIKCLDYDKGTSICIEEENGIYDLHAALNIRGLLVVDIERISQDTADAGSVARKQGWKYNPILSNKNMRSVYVTPKGLYMVITETRSFEIYNRRGKYMKDVDFDGRYIAVPEKSIRTIIVR